MRTNTQTYFTMMYPDSYILSALPAYIVIGGNGGVLPTSVTLTISKNGTAQGSRKTVYANKQGYCYVDISPDIRDLFGDMGGAFSASYSSSTPAANRTKVDVSVSVYIKQDNGGASTASFSLSALYGTMRLDGLDSYQHLREIKAWKGLPFTVGAHGTVSTSKLSIVKDRGVILSPDVLGSAVIGVGCFNYRVIPDSMAGEYVGIQLSSGHAIISYDETYGQKSSVLVKTQSDLMPKRIYNIQVEKYTPKDFAYLRYVNHYGFFEYWAFAKGDAKTTSEVSGAVMRENILSRVPNRRVVRYNESYVVPMCATRLTDGQFDALTDILTSPKVDIMKAGSETNPVWIPVNVLPRSVQRDRKSHIHQMEIEVEYTDLNTLEL